MIISLAKIPVREKSISSSCLYVPLPDYHVLALSF